MTQASGFIQTRHGYLWTVIGIHGNLDVLVSDFCLLLSICRHLCDDEL